MIEESMKPFGRALLDFHKGNLAGSLTVVRSDGLETGLEVSRFFRAEAEFSTIDKVALSLCKGRVLDVGAGAGPISLVLQDKGHEVCAIDVIPEAVEIMLSRGVKEVRCTDFLDFEASGFDTILILCHGLGIARNLEGLGDLLMHSRSMLNPGGIIVADSLDPGKSDDPDHVSYRKRNEEEGRYCGEVRFSMTYNNMAGGEVEWLNVDPDTLKKVSEPFGFYCEIVCEEAAGDYLVKLSLSPPPHKESIG